jgi:cell division protein FtsL
MRLQTIIWTLVIIVSAYGLYQVKYQVRDVKKEAARIDAQLQAENKTLHVLKAEWVYLNRPARLQELSRKHLDLVPLAADQMMDNHSLADLAMPEDDGKSVADSGVSTNKPEGVTPTSGVAYGR